MFIIGGRRVRKVVVKLFHSAPSPQILLPCRTNLSTKQSPTTSPTAVKTCKELSSSRLGLGVEGLLIVLDAFEELAEVALAEPSAARSLVLPARLVLDQAPDPLDDFDEHGGTIPQGLGEDLEQHALIVLVPQDPQLLALLVLRSGEGIAQAPWQALVVDGVGLGHEIEASAVGALPHLAKGGEDVVGFEGDVLQPRTLILLEICLDLRSPLGAKCGLVHGQQDHLVIGGQNNAVEPGVDSPHITRNELRELVEPCPFCDVVPRADKVIHVADNVVHPLQAIGERGGVDTLIPPEERPLEPAVLHQPQHDVPVKRHLRH
mmetsp:Transcript_70238/g.222690  ORF Transcript_70238/g.222690 Transcript_70238/m.222690 type:complete len:319 (-) Transcript_70238:1162-2118(-)